MSSAFEKILNFSASNISTYKNKYNVHSKNKN